MHIDLVIQMLISEIFAAVNKNILNNLKNVMYLRFFI